MNNQKRRQLVVHLDEMNIVLIKEMDMVERLMGLHPKETMFSKNSLEVSDLVCMSNQSLIHWNGFLATAYDVPESVRFEF